MTEVDWLNTFGDNLKDILDGSLMTQRDLAEAAGLSEATISSYLHKQKMPGMRAIINLAYALDCSVDDLVDFGCRIR